MILKSFSSSYGGFGIVLGSYGQVSINSYGFSTRLPLPNRSLTPYTLP